VLFACCALFIALSVAGSLVAGQAKFWFGVLAGATMTAYLAVRDSPPAHIENWRLGSHGERRTARVLRPLAREEWAIWHDRDGGDGTNIDHVAVGGAGVFLLDSKNYSGEASLENGELRVRWLEDPDEGWVSHGIVRRMCAASAELSERIKAAVGVRVWVQPVVVLWMRFPQRVVEVSGVFFVQGDALAEWLLGRKPSSRSFEEERVNQFLAGAAARHR
jgi:hypothetical protein